MGTPVIAIANQKGGVGKTTTAINLAACLTVQRQNVLLIDLDPQANATSGLGVEKAQGQSIYRALLGEVQADTLVRPTAYKRLDIIASEVDLAGAEVDIARADNYLHRLKEALVPVTNQDRYDFIFVDCPPSLGILTMNALTAAESLLIPLQCEYYALEGLSVIIDLVEKLRTSGTNPGLRLEGIVMTMYDGRTNLSQAVVQDVYKHFGNRIYETLIPRTIRLGEAPSFGKPIIDHDRQSVGAVAYLQLAKEFLQRRGSEESRTFPFQDESPIAAAAEAEAAQPESSEELPQ
ncbi:MAG: Sporulation initiation inhibitor protein Soj [Verrucomicrobia bacterium ADurb.Bin345]|nr:MAG: Sporulation initiation inhibitor protein Soj [Verrucomicrobia bacterium ADurb.Bin345]